MCRLLIIIGEKKESNKVKEKLIESLIKSSKYDPYSIALFGEDDSSHKDGWGRFHAIIGEGYVKTTIHRSTKPIYEDIILNDDIGEGDLEIDVIHARSASTGMPINLFSIHPMEAINKNGYKIYVFHNGFVDKNKLLTYLGIDENSKYAKLYTDTYFLTQYIAHKVEEGIDINLIKDITHFTKTALNINILMIEEDEIQILVGSYYKLIDKIFQRRNYYKMYFGKINENLYLYTSSTLIDFYKPNIHIEWNEVPNGKFDIYSIIYRYKPELKLKYSYCI